MRNGQEYLASLNDGRTVLVDGEAVDNVAEHPAFAPIAKTIAGLYDISVDPANGMQFHSEDIDGPANLAFNIPSSAEELQARRHAVSTWAHATRGWVGRSPDHVGSFLSGFASNAAFFDTDERKFSENITKYYKKVIEEDLYVSYAIIPPQFSRATTAAGWEGDYIQVGVVSENEQGLIVRGSQMLATGGAVADELLVSCIKPLGPDDTNFAISFALPVNTNGMKFITRRPYAPAVTSEFDYPLSSRFDEPDALVVFDDVLVPWDRVFVDRDVSKVRNQFFATPAHVLGNWQAQIRFSQKLQFIASVARKVTEVNGTDKFPGVMEKLGELASLVSVVDSAVLAAEYTAAADENGVLVPGRPALYGAMGLQSEIYPRIIQILRDLVGGGVLQLPSSEADMNSDLTKGDIDRYITSPGVDSNERIKLFRLVWDIIGSEFAGRHQQYELFYAGAPFVVKGVYAYQNFGYPQLLEDLNEFLKSYAPA